MSYQRRQQVTDWLTLKVGPQCPATHPGGGQCERMQGHDGSHTMQEGRAGWSDDSYLRAKDRRKGGAK